MSHHSSIHCPSCNAPIAKNYCAACGEKKRTVHDLTVKHFFEETIEGFTHFDGRFFRTIRLLFFSPGRLSENFETGKRVNYMKPFQLFLVANLLFFLVAHGPNLFATRLSSFYSSSNYTMFGTKHVIETKLNTLTAKRYPGQQISQHKTDVGTELALEFNEKIVTQSKLFILLFIPLIGIACGLLFINKKKFFALHLVFATHFFSFVLLYFLVCFILVELPTSLFLNVRDNALYDNVFGISSLVVFITYLFFATRRFYHARILRCLVSSIALTVFFLVILNAYRLFLFYKIINSIS